MKHLYILCISFVGLMTGHVNFILIGPPGSGKRTFGMYLEKNHGYHQIFPGTTKWYMPVPSIPHSVFDNSKYFYGLHFDRLHNQVKECVRNKRPFVIHYFPQNKCSLDFLQDLCQLYGIKETIRIVYFVVDDETCIERANNRMQCVSCYTIYNKTTCPPKCKDRCDMCNAILKTHTSNEKVIKSRLAYYRKSIEPLVKLVEKYFHCINFFADVPWQECTNYYESFLV